MTEQNNSEVNNVVETPEQELMRLRAENATLKTKQAKGVTIQFSEKGCISLYGLGRFPVSLYPEKWAILIANIEAVKQFMADNAQKCQQITDSKPQAKKPVAA